MSTPKSPERPKFQAWLVALAIFAGTCALYWPVRTHDFVGLDDPDYVTENPNVNHGLSGEAVAWAFRSKEASNWHPLAWLSHMLDCELFGLKPAGHHLVNVGWHAINAVLLFLLLRRMTGAFWRAAFVAACFAWHPLRVESVAWISERKDVLSMFFGLLALWAYVRFAEKSKGSSPKSKVWFGAALLFFALGLMSKPMLVTLPFVLLLLDHWPLRRKELNTENCTLKTFRPLVLEKIPFFLLSAVSCALTVWAQGAGHAIGSTQQFPLLTRVANALVAYGEYGVKFFWPTKLAVFYPYPTATPVLLAVLTGAVLVVLTVAVVHCRKSRPYLAVGWFWFLGTLVPVIGLVQVGGQAWADRYSYLPGVGLLMAVVWLVTDFLKPWAKAKIICTVGAVAILAACATTSWAQIKVWRDSQALFEHARAVTERNYLAWTVLGGFLGREGKLDEALRYYETALAMQPDYPGGLTGIGNIYEKRGDYEKALSFHDRALLGGPFDPEVVNGRAAVLARLGRFAEAETGFQEALKLRPDYSDAIFNLGSILQRQGRLAEAQGCFEKSIALMPQSTNALFALGTVMMRSQRPADALQSFDRALKLSPNWNEARYSRALTLIELGKAPEAAAEFKSLLTVMTNPAPALDGLGFALGMQGQTVEAEKYLRQALAADPKMPTAHLHLAMMLAPRGEIAEAIRHYRLTLETETNQPAALNNLAWILATHPDDALRNGKDAVTFAERACQLSGRREPFLLGTLAAAYAEVGDFHKAVATAREACDLATKAGRPDIAKRNEELLNLYKSGQPFRDNPPPR
ncbi:MAG: tetratricopeptide repeat protein [Pedosphaera sp.]|nr:tetratricopeptide repeat protein [Pedosphaera sp.]